MHTFSEMFTVLYTSCTACHCLCTVFLVANCTYNISYFCFKSKCPSYHNI